MSTPPTGILDGILARRGRALPDALLDGPTLLRRHHPPRRAAPRVPCPASPPLALP